MPPSSPSEELREQPTHHLLEPRSGAAQAPWLEPQAQWMLSVHREECPGRPRVPAVCRRRGAGSRRIFWASGEAQALWLEPQVQRMLSVRPSSPQEESRRQQMHQLLKPHSRAAQAVWLEPRAQRLLSVRHKEVLELAVCPSSPQEELRRQQTHRLLEPRSRTAPALRNAGAESAVAAASTPEGRPLAALHAGSLPQAVGKGQTPLPFAT